MGSGFQAHAGSSLAGLSVLTCDAHRRPAASQNCQMLPPPLYLFLGLDQAPSLVFFLP